MNKFRVNLHPVFFNIETLWDSADIKNSNKNNKTEEYKGRSVSTKIKAAEEKSKAKDRKDCDDLERQMWINDITEEEYEALCTKQDLSISELEKIVWFNQKKNKWIENTMLLSTLRLSLKTLTQEQAILLSSVKDLDLTLDNITEDQAAVLWKCKILHLELPTITKEQIKRLTSSGNMLTVNLSDGTQIQYQAWGLLIFRSSKLTSQQIQLIEWFKYLKPWQGIDIEIKMDKLTDEQLLALCSATSLHLSIKTLTDKQAEYLSKWKFNNLSLFWLMELTDKQAEYLSGISNLHFKRNILTPVQKKIFAKSK